MRERPILFSGEMVRAILAGTKSQTRRLLTPQPFSNGMRYSQELGDIVCHNDYLPPSAMLWKRGSKREPYYLSDVEDEWTPYCPHGVPGDRLWVRETWAPIWPAEFAPEDIRDCEIQYRADWPNDKYPGHWPEDCGDDEACGRWKPSIHMPRWASRLTLEVTSVHVERLQDISEADARAEGFPLPYPVDARLTVKELDGTVSVSKAVVQFIDPKMAFYSTWQALNEKRAPWASNPYVWVVGFTTLHQEPRT